MSRVFTPYRVPAGRLITMCSGTTTTSLQMNCRSSPTSYATPMCAAPAQFPSQHLLTMPIWWLSGLAITWWTKSTTGKRLPLLLWAVYAYSFEPIVMKASLIFIFYFFWCAVSVPRAAIHQDRVTGVTNRPWPRLFRSTRTPCAPCTLPESTQPQIGVGETPLTKRTTPCCLTVDITVVPHCDLPTKQTCQLQISLQLYLSLWPTQKKSQLLDCKMQNNPSFLGFELKEVLFTCCALVCVCFMKKCF